MRELARKHMINDYESEYKRLNPESAGLRVNVYSQTNNLLTYTPLKYLGGVLPEIFYG